MTRIALGAWGERYTARKLNQLGWVASVAPLRYAGDVKAVSPDGEIRRIEVKTATLGKDGTYRFNLKKEGHTDCVGADVVVCLCVMDLDVVIPFVIPVSAIGTRRVIAISKNVTKYAGLWADYRQKWEL